MILVGFVVEDVEGLIRILIIKIQGLKLLDIPLNYPVEHLLLN